MKKYLVTLAYVDRGESCARSSCFVVHVAWSLSDTWSWVERGVRSPEWLRSYALPHADDTHPIFDSGVDAIDVIPFDELKLQAVTLVPRSSQ